MFQCHIIKLSSLLNEQILCHKKGIKDKDYNLHEVIRLRITSHLTMSVTKTYREGMKRKY